MSYWMIRAGRQGGRQKTTSPRTPRTLMAKLRTVLLTTVLACLFPPRGHAADEWGFELVTFEQFFRSTGVIDTTGTHPHVPGDLQYVHDILAYGDDLPAFACATQPNYIMECSAATTEALSRELIKRILADNMVREEMKRWQQEARRRTFEFRLDDTMIQFDGNELHLVSEAFMPPMTLQKKLFSTRFYQWTPILGGTDQRFGISFGLWKRLRWHRLEARFQGKATFAGIPEEILAKVRAAPHRALDVYVSWSGLPGVKATVVASDQKRVRYQALVPANLRIVFRDKTGTNLWTFQ